MYYDTSSRRYYRRNADTDLRNVERNWLVASTADNLHRYVIALYRTGEISRALNVLDMVIGSNDRRDLDDMFKNQKLLQAIRKYSSELISRVPGTEAYYTGATIHLRRNRKEKLLMPFWTIHSSIDMVFTGEDYEDIDKDDIDEDTADEHDNTAQNHIDAVTEHLDDTFNGGLISMWGLADDSDTWEPSVDFETEDENPPEEGYELVDGDFRSVDADDFVTYIEDLEIDDELRIRGVEVRDGDVDYKVEYSVSHISPLTPYQFLAILVSLHIDSLADD